MGATLGRLWRASVETLTRMPATPVRAVGVAAFFLAFVAFEALTRACLCLDDLLYPGWRRVPIRGPVFIVGNPRSGTSFTHRLLAADTEAFTGLTLADILFPAVCQRRLLSALGRVDAALGRPAGRLLDRIERRAFAGTDAVRRIRLGDPEEDEMLLAHLFATPSLAMVFPGAVSLLELVRFDDLPEAARRPLMAFYEGCLRRHLLTAPAGRRLLSKNTTFPLKIRSVAAAFPDAHFLWVVRDPAESVASTLSMFDATWRLQLPPEAAAAMRARLLETACLLYTHAQAELGRLAPGRVTVLPYARLRADPAGVMEEVYARLGIAPGEAARAGLREASRRAAGFESRHRYDGAALGVDVGGLRAAMPGVYARFAAAGWREG